MTEESSSLLDIILSRCRRVLRTPHALGVLASVWVLGSVMLALGIAVTMKLARMRAFTSSSAVPMAYGLTQKHSLILLVTAVSLHLVLLVLLLGSILSDRPSSSDHPQRQSLPAREEDGTKTEDAATTFEKDVPPSYEALLLAETPPPPFHSTIWRTPSIESLAETSCLNSNLTLTSESLLPYADKPKMTSCDSKNNISDSDNDVAKVEDLAKEKIRNIEIDNRDKVSCGLHHQTTTYSFSKIGSCVSLFNNEHSNNNRSEVEANIRYMTKYENFESTSANPICKKNRRENNVKIDITEKVAKKREEKLSSKSLFNLAERQGMFIITVSPDITASESSKEVQRNYRLETPSSSKLVNNSEVLLPHPFEEDLVEDLEHDAIYKEKYTKTYKTAGKHNFEIMPFLHNNSTIKQTGTNTSHYTFAKSRNLQYETPLLPVLNCISTENISYECTSLPPHTYNLKSSTLFTHRPSRNTERCHNEEYLMKGASKLFLLPRSQPISKTSKSVSNHSLESGIQSCSSLVTSHVAVNAGSKNSVVAVNAGSKNSVNSYEIVKDSPKITPDSAIGSIVSVNISL